MHPDFVHEPEPYAVLVEELGEEFSAEPCVEDFLRQLEFNIARLKQHETGSRVIYERCPIDFLAYVECAGQTLRTDEVIEAIQSLDLIVYLPIDNAVHTEDFPKLRKQVDRRLSAIYREDDLGIISATGLAIIEATGPVEKRLRIVEAAMKESLHSF